MRVENVKIQSSCDGLMLDTLIYIPDSPRGIVQISHGMAEHKERYKNFMEYLCNNGYVVVINDHRGHGKSIRDSNDLGYFYDESGKFIVDDLLKVTVYIKDRFSGLPVILLGHSMGSLVVRAYLKKYPKEINKLIVCGSPSKNDNIDMAITLTKLIKKVKGDRYRSNFIYKLVFGKYMKDFSGDSPHQWICSNIDVVNEYDKDNLCGFVFTTNGFLNLFHLMKDVYNRDGWLCENIDIPILFVAGNADPVIDSEVKWQSAQDFLRSIGYTRISSKLYPNLRHEILNEIGKEEVYNDILEFIGNN